ncbi:hypothetical protein SAMN05443582_1021000 [Phyllobacterium sp. OV277]|nr:hypothetical protein SAMN05443582_1021000 [Phyllobacterium sp. OV277]
MRIGIAGFGYCRTEIEPLASCTGGTCRALPECATKPRNRLTVERQHITGLDGFTQQEADIRCGLGIAFEHTVTKTVRISVAKKGQTHIIGPLLNQNILTR